MKNEGTSPRVPDEHGWAWGLVGDQPEQLWERFSPAYEAQARILLAALARYWPTVKLAWAGSEDGEAAVAIDSDDTIAFCYHLEEPRSAKDLADAIAQGGLDDLIAKLAPHLPKCRGS